MIPAQLSKEDIRKHTLIWTLIIIFISLVDPVKGGVLVNIVGGILVYSNYIFLYYFLALHIFPHIKDNLSRATYRLIIAIIIYFLIKYLRNVLVIPSLNGVAVLNEKPFFYQILDGILQIVVIGASAYVFYLHKLNVWRLNQQKFKEVVLIDHELSFLKNQFNTHLTFNFLNFCYSNLYKYSERVHLVIEVFSDLLQYSLVTDADKPIELEKELSYLESYLLLQKTLTTNLYIDYLINNTNEEKHYILPRTLVSLLEFALINGESSNKNKPTKVDIVVNDDLLSVKILIINKRIHKVLNYDTLDNIKKLFSLYYPNRHDLSIVTANGTIQYSLLIYWKKFY